MKKKNILYRPEIDGLRAFAVIAVIINHFNKDILPSGYLGVDIFFVISGFVITSSLDGRRSENISEFLGGFYSRRLRRLIPGLIFFVIITSFIICILDPDPVSSLKTGFFSIFGLSNFVLFRDSVDYFAQSSEFNPFTHTWSLAVEEQFYFIFPFFVWFSGFGENKNQSSRRLFLLMVLTGLFSLVCFLVIYPIRTSAAYFLMPTRFWEIASGSLLYLSIKNNFVALKLLKKIPTTFVLLVIFIILFLPQDFGMILTLVTVILTCILINNIESSNLIYKLLTYKSFAYIGLASYSLYLWHWPIISFTKWISINNNYFSLLQFLAFITISILSYEFVEKPFRSNFKLSFNRSIVFIVALFSSLATAFFNRFLFHNYQNKFFLSARDFLAPASEPINHGGIIQHELIRFCHDPSEGEIKNVISRCLKIKNRDNKNAIFIFGDSHATNHYPSIESANKSLKNKFHIKFLAENGMITSIYSRDNCFGVIRCLPNSWEKHKEFFDNELIEGDIIVFSWVRYRLSKLRTSNLPRPINQKRVDRLERKLLEINKIINNKGAKFLLVNDIPATCKNPEINFSYFILKAGKYELCQIDKRISELDRKGLTQIYKKLSELNSNIFYVDFHDELCKENFCTIFDPKNGKLLYGDNRSHFTSIYPDPLAEEWQKVLSRFQ